MYCISDLNECKDENGGCEHTCVNTNGSYECTCKDGYQLTKDKKKCQGKQNMSRMSRY